MTTREKTMTHLHITRHAQTRMSQRGIRESDPDVILALGTEIGPDRIMLMKQDARKEIEALKKRIANIERLTGKVLVVSDGCLVTAYHKAGRDRASRRGKNRRRR